MNLHSTASARKPPRRSRCGTCARVARRRKSRRARTGRAAVRRRKLPKTRYSQGLIFMDNDVINELLFLIDSMAEQIEALELAKNEQDAINTLLTEQIVAMNNCIRETHDGLKTMQ